MNIDLKRIFSNEQKYNGINLLDASIYENIIGIYCELINHENKEKYTKELQLIEKFMKLYDKFSKYLLFSLVFFVLSDVVLKMVFDIKWFTPIYNLYLVCYWLLMIYRHRLMSIKK